MSRLSREQSRDLTQHKPRQSPLSEFATSGFAGASFDRIAEAAGFSRGAFYAIYKGGANWWRSMVVRKISTG
jgi:hypothetical protein